MTDSLVEILIDCNINKKPLTIDRLHGWHNCLFEHSRYSGLDKINVASFRNHDTGVENFEGGISTKKYIALTKVSKATAVRDISQLVEFGCIEKIKGSSGRNVRYVICE